MSSVFVIPICVATVVVGLITYYICSETKCCNSFDQKKYNSEDYRLTPFI